MAIACCAATIGIADTSAGVRWAADIKGIVQQHGSSVATGFAIAIAGAGCLWVFAEEQNTTGVTIVGALAGLATAGKWLFS